MKNNSAFGFSKLFSITCMKTESSYVWTAEWAGTPRVIE